MAGQRKALLKLMTEAFRCDMCGEYHDGKPSIMSEMKVQYRTRKQKEQNSKQQEYCSEDCFIRANKDAIIEVALDEVQSRPKFL